MIMLNFFNPKYNKFFFYFYFLLIKKIDLDIKIYLKVQKDGDDDPPYSIHKFICSCP